MPLFVLTEGQQGPGGGTLASRASQPLHAVLPFDVLFASTEAAPLPLYLFASSARESSGDALSSLPCSDRNAPISEEVLRFLVRLLAGVAEKEEDSKALEELAGLLAPLLLPLPPARRASASASTSTPIRINMLSASGTLLAHLPFSSSSSSSSSSSVTLSTATPGAWLIASFSCQHLPWELLLPQVPLVRSFTLAALADSRAADWSWFSRPPLPSRTPIYFACYRSSSRHEKEKDKEKDKDKDKKKEKSRALDPETAHRELLGRNLLRYLCVSPKVRADASPRARPVSQSALIFAAASSHLSRVAGRVQQSAGLVRQFAEGLVSAEEVSLLLAVRYLQPCASEVRTFFLLRGSVAWLTKTDVRARVVRSRSWWRRAGRRTFPYSCSRTPTSWTRRRPCSIS